MAAATATPVQPWATLADLVLLAHFALVVFVVGGLALVIAGNRRGWQWVNAPGFRALHLAAIAVVVAQAWFGVTCPLTVLENALRLRAGGEAYAGGLIAHWVGRLLYYDAPPWVFGVAYSAFGLLVLLTWWRYPPSSAKRTQRDARAAGR